MSETGWNIETLKSYFDEKFKQIETARKLQAKEYKRRLKGLNGEAGRLKEIQSEYIPREVFDRTATEIKEKFDSTVNDLRERIELLIVWKTKEDGKSQLLQYIPWILTTIALVFTWLNYKK